MSSLPYGRQTIDEADNRRCRDSASGSADHPGTTDRRLRARPSRTRSPPDNAVAFAQRHRCPAWRRGGRESKARGMRSSPTPHQLRGLVEPASCSSVRVRSSPISAGPRQTWISLQPGTPACWSGLPRLLGCLARWPASRLGAGPGGQGARPRRDRGRLPCAGCGAVRSAGGGWRRGHDGVQPPSSEGDHLRRGRHCDQPTTTSWPPVYVRFRTHGVERSEA